MSDASSLRDEINRLRKAIDTLDRRKNAVINARNKLDSIEKQFGAASSLSRNLSSAFNELPAGALWGTDHLKKLSDYDDNAVLRELRIDCSSYLNDEIDACLKRIDVLNRQLKTTVAEYNKLV